MRYYRDVLQGNYAPRFLVRGEFKIVETVIVQNEPSTFPTLIPRKQVFMKTLLGLFLSSRPQTTQPMDLGFWIKGNITTNQFSPKLQKNHLPPCFHNQPSLSGLKKVCIKSLPSSSGILNGSVLIESKRETSSSLGRFSPSLIPLTFSHEDPTFPGLKIFHLFMVMNCSTLGLSLTLGLCRLVLSMMMAKLRT